MDVYDDKPKSKKKFTLSLKKAQNEYLKEKSISGINSQNSKIPNNHNKNHSNTSESSDSQNFLLRVSDSFVVDDSDGENGLQKYDTKKNDMEVIVISDSNDEDDSPNLFTKNNEKRGTESLMINLNFGKDHEHLIQKCESIFCIDSSDEEENPFSRRKRYNQNSKKCINSKKDIQYTSDESGVGLKIPICECTSPIKKISTFTPVANKNTNYLKNQNSNSSKKNNNDGFGTPNSIKLSERTTPLTKKEMRTIKKTIDSKKLVYDPTVQWNRNEEISETDSDSEQDVYIFKGGKKNIHPALIDETESEQDSIEDGENHTPNPTKTHISKFQNPNIQDDPQATLSARKKKQISKWLMTNSDNKSDESMSNVSPSTRNSINSGNSSLERLEENYETPNNRDKFHRIFDSGNKGSGRSTTSTIKPQMTQTQIDEYLKKKKLIPKERKTIGKISIRESSKTPSMVLPGKTKTINVNKCDNISEKLYEKQRDVRSNVRSEEIKKTDEMDCADILDKLYGNAWREYPVIESRKTKVTLEDKGVQTERKNRTKSRIKKCYSTGSSSTDDDNIILRKSNRKHKEDSFINDLSSGGSEGETSYMTALTNPRISDLAGRMKNTPMSATTRKAIEICDSDSEKESEKIQQVTEILDNRRRLEFSDHDNSSSTSEYDPYDIVPPKILPKSSQKIVPPRSSSKLTTTVNNKVSKTKSFLASLSASVPFSDAHPDSRKYRTNFKNTKDELCKYLYKLYNEKIFDNSLPHDMLIEWNIRMRGTAGFCYNRKITKAAGVIERSSRLVLATKILDTADRLRDTLVHELCHAAAWLVNNVSDGHGPFWKSWASKAMKAFPELPQIKRCHDYEIKTKFTYRCTSCGYSIGRHSKSLDIDRKRCGHCHGKFELLINKVTKTGTKLETPKKKEPTAFALYVKENYKTIKKERHGLAHKEVMQLLGQQFSAIKISKKNNDIEGNSG